MKSLSTTSLTGSDLDRRSLVFGLDQHVAVGERDRSVAQRCYPAGEFGRLGQVRVLHGRLGGVEEDDVVVAVRVVAVLEQELPAGSALALGSLQPLLVESLEFLPLRCRKGDDLGERHSRLLVPVPYTTGRT